jgi:conjugal transfer mating pair stabilization protein TraG
MWESVKFAASQSYPGFMEATRAWADHRVNEVADRLTPNQQAYYRAALFEAFAGIDVGGTQIGVLDKLKQQMIDEDGTVEGNNIAKLLLSATGQNRMDLVNQIGNYNRALGRVNY